MAHIRIIGYDSGFNFDNHILPNLIKNVLDGAAMYESEIAARSLFRIRAYTEQNKLIKH